MINWQEILDRYADRPLFVSETESVSYSGFYQLMQNVPVTDKSRLAESISLKWTAVSFATFLNVLANGITVTLDDSVAVSDLEQFPDGRPFIILKTGGTTGGARHVVHSARALMQPYNVLERNEQKILILYAPDHIAGLDAFFQAIHRGSTLIIPPDSRVDSIGHAIEHHGVEVMPATPGFLQFLLLGGINEKYCLDSVTVIPHGAEHMPDRLRKRIFGVLKNAKLQNRYGLTEMGALPVREDEEDPGALFLDAPGYDWKLVDGELQVRGPTPFLGTLEEGPILRGDYWHATGDLGEYTRRGSIRILGRRDFLINVGGEKVLPETVENLILNDPEVEDVIVFGQPHAFTGQSVAAQVKFKANPNSEALIRRLRKSAVEIGLSLPHVPMRIDPVNHISRSRTGKRPRSMENLDFDSQQNFT